MVTLSSQGTILLTSRQLIRRWKLLYILKKMNIQSVNWKNCMLRNWTIDIHLLYFFNLSCFQL